MSVWFPVHRPRMGLSVSDRGLALVEVRRGRRQPSMTRVQERLLPDGLLTLSPDEPNINDRETLRNELRAMLAGTAERTLAVCVPDQVCRLGIFPFETVPSREQDREAIVRYRFQHDEHVILPRDTVILQRVFPASVPPALGSGDGAGGNPIAAWVLAMAIKRSVLDEYRALCEEAGLLPMAISCASLWRFDFCRSLMPEGAELFFAHCAADALTCLAVRQGVPVFCRSKASRRASTDVLRELHSTVQYYDDFFPARPGHPRSGAVPIYMLGAQWPGENLLLGNAPGVITDSGGRTGAEPWHVNLVRLDWETRISCEVNRPQSEEGLSALACAMGA